MLCFHSSFLRSPQPLNWHIVWGRGKQQFLVSKLWSHQTNIERTKKFNRQQKESKSQSRLVKYSSRLRTTVIRQFNGCYVYQTARRSSSSRSKRPKSSNWKSNIEKSSPWKWMDPVSVGTGIQFTVLESQYWSAQGGACSACAANPFSGVWGEGWQLPPIFGQNHWLNHPVCLIL